MEYRSNIIDIILPMRTTESERKMWFNEVKIICKKFNLIDHLGECPYDHLRWPLAIRLDLVRMDACLHNSAKIFLNNYNNGFKEGILFNTGVFEMFPAIYGTIEHSLTFKLNVLLKNV